MRLIDADTFKMEDFRHCLDCDSIIQVIKHSSTVDAVPVVRCGECKYWQDNNGGYPHNECRWSKDETPDPDDFCSYGERKDTE